MALLMYLTEEDHLYTAVNVGNLDTWVVSRLEPYVDTLDVFACPKTFVTTPWPTYMGNGGFWMFHDQRYEKGKTHEASVQYGNGISRPIGPMHHDEIKQPSHVVWFFETIRDWTGHLDRAWGAYYGSDAEKRYALDFQDKFMYYQGSDGHTKLTGGRHFRTGGAVGGDPWGMDNVTMADGHVEQNVSMQYMVTNEPTGVFVSHPCNAGSVGARTPNVGLRPIGADFWMVPWW